MEKIYPTQLIRCLDILISLILLILLLGPALAIYLILLLESRCPIYTQLRVGQYGKIFTIFKFRTMIDGVPVVPTHVIPSQSITPFGRFLRRSRLDEIPQLINVLFGEMSLVGPRPCLPTQFDVIATRARFGVTSLRPGITGPAQLKDVDMSCPESLVELDATLLPTVGLHAYVSTLMGTLVKFVMLIR